MGKITIITGLSGSGKSKYLKELSSTCNYIDNDMFIHFDELTKYYNKHTNVYNKYIIEFIMRHPYPNISKSDINWEKDVYFIHEQFLEFLYNYNTNDMFIIEGIQFIKPYISNKYIYKADNVEIIKTSPFKCFIRRIRRCFRNKNIFNCLTCNSC